MLLNMEGNVITRKCENCAHEHTVDLTGTVITFNTTHGEYDNLPVPCPNCVAVEYFNMNLPMGAEINLLNSNASRYYVKQLIATVREDYQGG